MKNKKGFTLVELLAVIVILAVVILIAVTAVVPRMNNAKKKAFIDESLVYLRAGNEINITNESTENRCFTISQLNQEYVKKDSSNYSGVLMLGKNGDKYLHLSDGKYYIVTTGDVDDIDVTTTKPSSFIESCPANVTMPHKITYNYNLDSMTVNNTNFIDTGYAVNFDNDFELKLVGNFPVESRRYLLFGNFKDSAAGVLSIEIRNTNQLRTYHPDLLSSNTINFNENLTLTFRWNATTKRFVYTAVGPTTNIRLISQDEYKNKSGIVVSPLRIGRDYRSTNEFSSFTISYAEITTTYETGAPLSDIPMDVTQPSKTFSGWYSAKSGGNQILSSKIVDQSETYYARWQ